VSGAGGHARGQRERFVRDAKAQRPARPLQSIGQVGQPGPVPGQAGCRRDSGAVVAHSQHDLVPGRADLDLAHPGLAMPQHVGHRLTQHHREQRVGAVWQGTGVEPGPYRDPGRLEHRPRRADLGLERREGRARRDRADFGLRRGDDHGQLGDLGRGPVRVAGEEPCGQFGAQRDRGQAEAEQVVHVLGQPQTFAEDGELGDALSRLGQLGTEPGEPGERVDDEREPGDREDLVRRSANAGLVEVPDQPEIGAEQDAGERPAPRAGHEQHD